MRATAVTESRSIEFADIPQPTCGDYDVISQTLTCGICNGTDAKIIEGHRHDAVISGIALGFLKPRYIVDDVAAFDKLPLAMERIMSRESLKAVIRLA